MIKHGKIRRPRSAVAVYGWYQPADGAIDGWTLIWSVTKTHCKRGSGPLPEWFERLKIPPVLPGASPPDLWELARSTWTAWVDAGRPSA